MSSSVRAMCWLAGLALVIVGCQREVVKPSVAGACTPGALVMCVCPGGLSTGFIPCGADRTVTACGGCENRPPRAVSSATGSASASGSALGVAGRPASSPATAGGGSIGAAGRPATFPAAAMGCGVGEMCKTSLRGGGVKFCSPDPSAGLPPPCGGHGQACGSNGAGTCIDATPLGSPGALFCIYSSC
ncbi:MAG TPA: hypothetical protein VJR89_25135 [Polyangiales bacterium]|nr:hypothetical protein [Polyangiales bacterium]